jgi:hypothetical protein
MYEKLGNNSKIKNSNDKSVNRLGTEGLGQYKDAKERITGEWKYYVTCFITCNLLQILLG